METIIDLDLPYPTCADHYVDPFTGVPTHENRAYHEQAEAECFIPKGKRYPEGERSVIVTIHHPSDRRACDDERVQLVLLDVLDRLRLLPFWMMDSLLVFHGAPREGGLLAVEIKDGGHR